MCLGSFRRRRSASAVARHRMYSPRAGGRRRGRAANAATSRYRGTIGTGPRSVSGPTVLVRTAHGGEAGRRLPGRSSRARGRPRRGPRTRRPTDRAQPAPQASPWGRASVVAGVGAADGRQRRWGRAAARGSPARPSGWPSPGSSGWARRRRRPGRRLGDRGSAWRWAWGSPSARRSVVKLAQRYWRGVSPEAWILRGQGLPDIPEVPGLVRRSR